MTNQWSVAIGVAAGKGQRRVPKLAERSGVLLDALADRGGVTTAGQDGRRYGARFWVGASGPVEAAEQALTVFRQAAADVGLPAWDVVEVEVLAEAELERQNALPSLPELVGVTEVAELLEVTRQRASTLARSASFPAPVVTLRSGPVWTRGSVDRFVQSWRRQPGRSATTRPAAGGAPQVTVRRQAARARGDRDSG